MTNSAPPRSGKPKPRPYEPPQVKKDPDLRERGLFPDDHPPKSESDS